MNVSRRLGPHFQKGNHVGPRTLLDLWSYRFEGPSSPIIHLLVASFLPSGSLGQCFSNFSWYQNQLEGLLKSILLSLCPRVSESIDLGCGLRILIFNMSPDEDAAAGLEPTLRTTDLDSAYQKRSSLVSLFTYHLIAYSSDIICWKVLILTWNLSSPFTCRLFVLSFDGRVKHYL